MSLIYKITNKITNEAYIGKTSRPLKIRLQEHQNDCKNYKGTNIALYNAIQKWGWEQFNVEVVEDNIPQEELNKKEKYYIALFDTYSNGYNCTLGGDGGRTSSKLTEREVEEIVQELKDPDSLKSFTEIAKKYNIDSSIISSINTGRSWYIPNENYPLRKYNTTGLSLTRDQYKNIVFELLNSKKSLDEIAKTYNLSQDRMTAINQGYECYNNLHPYYKGIYNGDFPIRKTSNKKLQLDEKIFDILYDILFTKNSMAKIGEKYNISGSALQYIQAGQRRKELTKDFITPLRNNIEINQKIYNKIIQQKG